MLWEGEGKNHPCRISAHLKLWRGALQPDTLLVRLRQLTHGERGWVEAEARAADECVVPEWGARAHSLGVQNTSIINDSPETHI